MSMTAIIGIVVLACLIGLIVVMSLGGIVAFAMGGRKKHYPVHAMVMPQNPFFAQFESALATVAANARVKAQQYDLAQQQELYDRVMEYDGEESRKTK